MDPTKTSAFITLASIVTLSTALLLPVPSVVEAAGNCPLSQRQAEPGNVVEVAATVPELSTLVAAIVAAELGETLAGAEAITVFAPTNAAFAKLPADTLAALLEPQNRAHLQRLLSYHVVPGKVSAARAAKLASAETLAGPRLVLSREGEQLRVDRARVTQVDIDGVNATLHLIDEVLLPPSTDLVETATAARQFSTLLAAAQAAGFVDDLAGGGPFTIFAPTDEAFAALPSGTVEALLEPQNRDHLQRLLRNHIVKQRVYADEALAARSLTNAAHESLEFALVEGRLAVNGVPVAATDVQATNGVIHIVDRVLVL